MAERQVNPYVELCEAQGADEYAAQIADNLGWVRVAAKIRKHGWSESSEDLIGRIERAMSWQGHWKESRLRLTAARDALAVLSVPIGVELLPYCLDLETIERGNVRIPSHVRQWLAGPDPRALANHPALGWIGLVANSETNKVDVITLGEQP